MVGVKMYWNINNIKKCSVTVLNCLFLKTTDFS